jgi:ACDE family multidrug resistance protein
MKIYHDRNFQIICGFGLSAMMMTAMIVPTFPGIIKSLGANEQSIGLILSLFTIPSLVLAPFAGIMADRWGRKKLLGPSIFLFGIFGGSCAFVSDFNILLALRFLQGMGGAPLVNVSMAVIGDLFTGQKRAEAMGLFITINYTGYIVYPFIGGILAGVGWNYPYLLFFLAVPLGVVALLYLDCPVPERRPGLREYMGNSLRFMATPRSLWLFSVALIGSIVFYGTYLTYFTLFLGTHFQASPFIVGLFVSFMGLAIALASSVMGILTKRLSSVSLVIIACFFYACAMLIIPVFDGLWIMLLPSIIIGIAHGLNLPSQNVMAASAAPTENRAGFMAAQGSFRMLGMTIGPPLTGLVRAISNIHTAFIAAGLIILVVPVAAAIIGIKRLK